jgi:hypothetical protein
MHYHVKTNALICRIKGLGKAHFGGFSLHQLLLETLPLCYWNLRYKKIDISLVTVYTTSSHSEPAVTSHLQPINQAVIYTPS